MSCRNIDLCIPELMGTNCIYLGFAEMYNAVIFLLANWLLSDVTSWFTDDLVAEREKHGLNYVLRIFNEKCVVHVKV